MSVIEKLKRVGKIGVLYGGQSAERAVSLRSGQAVLRAFQSVGADVVGIDVQFDGSLFQQMEGIDAAFIALHGRGGEDGVIQGLLDILGIPYTGSGVTASAIAMDKLKTKLIWNALGLPTPQFRAVTSVDQLVGVLEALGGTVMVKPPHEGSSIGMSKATTAETLVQAFEKAQSHDAEILIEQWVHGREFTCSLLNGEALPVIRLKTPHDFYDYDAKYQSNTTEYCIPSGLTPQEEAQLQALSVKAFDAVGCKGWGRVDAMQDAQGQFWLLEVNTVPGMTDHSLVPMAAKAKGIAFPQLVASILLGETCYA